MHRSTIVCAVDFSRASLLGLRMAVRYAAQANAHLRVVHVLAARTNESPSAQRRMAERMYAEVDEAIGFWSGTLEPVSSSVETGDVAEEVVRVAKRVDAELILIGVRATSTWERVRDGYIPGEIASTAGCPVVVIEVEEARLTGLDQQVIGPAQYN